MEKRVLLSILLCLFVVQLNANPIVSISGSSPSESNINGRYVIGVTGCGFRQYNTAVCTWDFEYFSPIHVILTDDLIYCETPNLSKEDFDVLPKTTSLYVYFDGDRSNSVLVNSKYVFGPSIISYTPFDGYIEGGEEMRIIGDGFSDFAFVNVTFDDTPCINTTIVNNHEITCIVPPGEFNQNAIVNLRFENNSKYFLHFERTYHYGPILYGISPPCGSVIGGTRVTILGTNLDDPILSFEADPEGYVPDVEVIYNDGKNRAYGLDIEFDSKNNMVLLTTPDIGSVFGNKVEFAVFFKKVLSKVAVSTLSHFVYGPIVYNPKNNGNSLTPIQNPSILSGHLGGEDFLNIYGCGLSDFEASQYEIFWNDQVLCQPGSITVQSTGNVKNDYLTCVTNVLPCGDGDNTGDVTVAINTGIPSVEDPQILPYSDEEVLTFQVGPIVNANSLSSNRGPRTGNQLISVEGSNFNYQGLAGTAQWPVIVHFVDPTNSDVQIPSVTGTILSDNQISFVTPVGLFDLDVVVSFDFGDSCPDYPRTSPLPSYHFGPICSEVTPANGYWSGGSDVTILGEGFEEDNNLPSDTYVRMCIERISTSTKCAFEEVPRDSFHLNDTQIKLVTPSARQNVVTKVGDNRLFGDVAQVWVHFYQPGGEFIEFPRNQLRPGLEAARIQCPNPYTFGPKVETVTPTHGQAVRRDANPTPLDITVNGVYFEDPNLKNNVSVTLNGLLTVDSDITSDNTVSSGVTWGLTANVDNDVQVIFDNGNRTYSGINIGYGPAIYSLSTAKLGNPIVSSFNPNGDIYGLFPSGNETIIVTGERFSEYSSETVRCTIGGDDVQVIVDSDTQIRCITSCRPFGSQASLSLSFGTFCSNDVIDWENTITAKQHLYFNPRVDSFSPAFGKTSGGDTVTIKGEGFSGWGKYECFFGHYSDQQHVLPSADGTTLVCKTPINRAEFNSHVTVSVQLSAFDDDDTVESGYVEAAQNCMNTGVVVDESVYAGVENHDFKIWANSKFYYGPVCNDISPSSCPLTGCVAAVVGTGFQDCVTGSQSVYTKNYPYNDCMFRYYRVRYVDPVTKDFTYVNAPTNDTLTPGNSNTKLFFYAPAHNCGYEPEIEIEFYNPVVSSAPSEDNTESQSVVKCTHPESRSYTFHYGPVFASQSSTYYDSSRLTSYGWSGDSITITGIDFRDPTIFGSVNCNFGENISVPAATVNTAGSTVVCQVPTLSQNNWNTLVDVSLTWSSGPQTCPPLHAQKFHFGPSIRSITPTRGYVAGEEPVTISGFAFGCCGITSYSCLFPAVTPPKVDDTKLIAPNTVTCTVPKNQFVDVLINNIGVGFSSSLFGTQDITFTEDNSSLKYYYGPKVTGYTPSHSTLSGRDQFVVIHGEGFKDPYLYETFCDFFNETSPGFDRVPIEPIEEIFITENTITCEIPLFAHYAQAVDKIRPRWRRYVEELRPELNKTYYKTAPPAVVDAPGAPFFSDGGSTTPVYLEGFKYGPVITSVCVDNLCNDKLPRSLVSGGLEITVTFDSLRDFVSNSTTKDFGSETALCVFGNRVADQVSPIIANPNADTPATVVCTTPAGDFNFDGEISVILNPLISADTTSNNQFHSKPYTYGISRDWVSSNGFETIVVYGSGFCQYTSVKCRFANGESNVDATQGDITNDKMVTCRTPSRAAGYSSLSLQFCSPEDFEVCNCGEEKDAIQVPESITFYGITSAATNEGNLCGGTTITYSGFGFKAFEKITCSWPNSGIQLANIIDDNHFTCSSIDVSSIFDNDIVHCSDIAIVGIRNNAYHRLTVPNKFEYGLPQIIDITPSTVNLQSLSTVTVRGLYLNGNGYDISCQFAGFVPSVGTLVADSNDNYFVLCNVPADISVGTYDLTLLIGCSSSLSFRTNTLHLTVTQTPIIDSVRPFAGPELGGQTITIQGHNFNGGSVYVCVFGAIPVGATYDEESSTLTCKTPAFLDTVEDVKVPLYISLDGGETLFRSKDDYIYQNIAVVDNENVCVKQEDLNEGSYLSVSLFFTILFICISLTL